MILTNEDLLAISQVVDTRLDIRLKPIEQDIKELKSDVAVLKEDVSVLKKDVIVLKKDVAVLKEDVTVLKENVAVLKKDVIALKENVTILNGKVQELETGLRSVRLFQENVILPRLNTIESCYTDTYRRYQKDCDKMETAFQDIDLLKKVAIDHSEKLQKLA